MIEPIALAQIVGSLSTKIEAAERLRLAALRALRTTIQPWPRRFRRADAST